MKIKYVFLLFITLIGCFSSVFVIDMVLHLVDKHVNQTSRYIALQNEVEFDMQNVHQKVVDLRNEESNTYPFQSPAAYLSVKTDYFIAGSYPNSQVVYCNELGEYRIYFSDRYGFDNNDAIWDIDSEINVFIGDSFGHGACVPKGTSFVDIVQKKYPGTLNLSMGGTGPILQYLILLNLTQGKAIKNLFICFYEGNDLTDMIKESRELGIVSYASSKSYSLDYMQNVQKFEAWQKKNYNEALDANRESWLKGKPLERYYGGINTSHYKLFRSLGKRFNSFIEPIENVDVAGLANVYEQIRLFSVDKKIERVIVLYLPSFDRYAGSKRTKSFYNEVVSHVERTAISKGFVFFDVNQLFEDTFSDPREAFPFRRPGHYTVEANKQIHDGVLTLLTIN